MGYVKNKIMDIVASLEENHYDWNIVAGLMGMDRDEVFEIAVEFCEIDESLYEDG